MLSFLGLSVVQIKNVSLLVQQLQSMCGCFGSVLISSSNLVTLGEFSVIKQSKLAEGAYGDVWKCKSTKDDGIYALKEIRLQSRELIQMYEKEARILGKLKDKMAKRSVRLIKAGIDPRKDGEVGCLLMEFGTITLFDQISSHKLNPKQFLNILYDIASALEEIHAMGVCHLDLKPENLIIIDNTYKICDFGSALESQINVEALPRKQKLKFQEYIQSNSTLIYRSPQMITLEDKPIGYASDLWMVGCIAYFMFFRKHPFEGEGKLAIISPNVKYSEESDHTKLIQSILQLNPASRPTAKALKQRVTQLQQQL